MILEEKSERRDQNFFSCLENINFRKSLPRAPEFEYPPLYLPYELAPPSLSCESGG